MHASGRMAFVVLAVFLTLGGPKAWAQAQVYDPNTTVYVDALWFRVHAADCPDLILKDLKKTMTLEQADKAGARIGESGQSGRTNCCLKGYKRKHPAKKLDDQTLLAGDNDPVRYKHIPGCHRYWPDRTHARRALGAWVADGFAVCPHCIERGPSVAAVSDEAWNQLAPNSFVAPAGWTPKPFPTDALPTQDEIDLLIQETMAKPNGIQELQFTDPVATMEHFVTMRFFFPVHNWLDFYKAYRATGDERLLEKMRESARHYNKLSRAYLTVAQAKASDPEGMPYLYTMAATARITLQLAKQDRPGVVGVGDIREAESFLQTAISVLRPTCEGRDDLDPEMGIPQELADDFRFRAYNRSMNGIGTLAMIAAALEDLQTIKKTRRYQPTIDRYRKVVHEYIKHWHSRGHFCTKVPGETHFYYSYAPREGEPRIENGCKVFRRPEDAGHYSHTLQGAMLIYESTPELGIDDAFMTAVANAMHHNSTTKITRRGKQVLSGHVECPTASSVRPYGKNSGRHQYSPARERFYLLYAFRPNLIDSLANPLNDKQKAQANSEYDKRLATLHAQYMKALRKDPSLIYLGQK